VIDLNIPKCDGFALIEHIRGAPRFDGVPVLVLTSSSADRDRSRSMALGANEFLTKPQHLDDFLTAVGLGIRRLLSGSRGPASRHRCSKDRGTGANRFFHRGGKLLKRQRFSGAVG
jgi:DNA-binding response OmpR family regulator